MRIPQVDYSRPVQELSTSGFDIQEPVRKFMQQSAIATDVSQMVTKSILKQAERDAEDKLITYREQLEKRKQDILSKRTVSRGNLPEEVNVPEGEGEEVKTSMYGASAFDAQSKADLDAFLATVPESMRDQFKQSAESARHQAMGQVFVQTQRWSIDEQAAEYESGLNRLMDIGDFQAARDLTDNRVDILGAEKAAEIKRQIDVRQSAHPIKEDILAGNIPAMKHHIAALSSKDYKGPLDENQRMAIVNTAKGRIAEISAEREAAMAKHNGSILANLMIGLEHGVAGEDGRPEFYDLMDIERVWNMDVGMTWAQKVQATDKYYARINKMQGDAASMSLVYDSLANGHKLNYRNTDHKKAVNTYYEHSLAITPPEQRPKLLMEVLQTGIVPSMVEDQIVSLGQSDKVEDIMSVAQIMNMAKQSAPLDYASIPIRDRAKVESVAALVTSGISPQTAIANTNRIAKYTDSQLEGMESNYKSLVSDSPNINFLTNEMLSDRDFDPWLDSPAQPTPFMATMFDDVVKAYYMTNGDINLSRKLAWGHIKNEWNRETINGDVESMHKGPSKVYGVSTPEIRTEFEKDAQAELSKMGVIDYTAKDLRLKSWDGTVRGSDPTWQVWAPVIKLDDGTKGYAPLTYADGSPMVWSMDEASVVKKKSEDAISKARIEKQREDAYNRALMGPAGPGPGGSQ